MNRSQGLGPSNVKPKPAKFCICRTSPHQRAPTAALAVTVAMNRLRRAISGEKSGASKDKAAKPKRRSTFFGFSGGGDESSTTMPHNLRQALRKHSGGTDVEGDECDIELLRQFLQAAKEGNAAQVAALLDAGVTIDGYDIASGDEDGSTALHLAAFGGHGAVIEVLAQHGAPLGAMDVNGMTAAHLAARYGRMEVLEALVTHEADMNVLSRTRASLAHMAAVAGNETVLRFLHQYGAPLDVVTSNGNTPQQVAEQRGHHAFVALLGVLQQSPSVASQVNPLMRRGSKPWAAATAAARLPVAAVEEEEGGGNEKGGGAAAAEDVPDVDAAAAAMATATAAAEPAEPVKPPGKAEASVAEITAAEEAPASVAVPSPAPAETKKKRRAKPMV